MHGDTEDLRELSYWPSVSDLFMTLFIIALVFLGALYYAFMPTSTTDFKSVVEAVGGVNLSRISEPTNKIRAALGTLPQLKRDEPAERVVAELSLTANEAVNQLESLKRRPSIELLTKALEEAKLALAQKDSQIAALNKRIADLEASEKALQGKNRDLEHALNDKPPIIKIAEAGKDGKKAYRFDSGKAKISPDFHTALKDGGFQDLAREILARNQSGLNTVDTLEIIGHTDGVAVSKHGNLDDLLPALLAGDSNVFPRLIPGSNNDLGLLRALAIKKEWLEFVATHPQPQRAQLEAIDVRCYSAGQTIPEGIPSDKTSPPAPELFKEENEESRRIEIRLTGLKR